MREAFQDIWDYLGKGIIAITTSGSLSRKGEAVPGRGVTRQAVQRFPHLPAELGLLIQQGGNHVHPLSGGLVSFPVEESAWACPDLGLISRSAEELRQLADREEWDLVVVPRPGCGGGGLSWHEVRPLLERHFDDRFLVLSDPEG